jgi:hypothetical protein
MRVFAVASALSTLEEESERLTELVFNAARVASRLDDELLRLRLEVWFVDIRVLVVLSAASTLLEELEIEFDEVLRIERVVSTLDDDVERLKEDV